MYRIYFIMYFSHKFTFSVADLHLPLKTYIGEDNIQKEVEDNVSILKLFYFA